ncbi:MAG: DM13 domain-containing protein [Fulvivirga sp.]|nr:DM13 domain-containing protein [Fulvivirga sp.]
MIKNIYNLFFGLLISLFLTACIGTDVVEEVVVPELLRISTAPSSIKVGDTFKFNASYFNTSGQREDVVITWSSADTSIISIDPEGTAMAHEAGNTTIYASYLHLIDSVNVAAGEETSFEMSREASLQGNSSYDIRGTALLIQESDIITLDFMSDFSATNGPGLHVYLSNDPDIVSGGVDLGSLKSTTGSQSYDVPSVIELNTYDYVVIFCKPFGVAFGHGKFN